MDQIRPLTNVFILDGVTMFRGQRAVLYELSRYKSSQYHGALNPTHSFPY